MKKYPKIAHLKIMNPISKMVTKMRTPKVDKRSGKLITHRTTYLTANAYYSGTDYFARKRIMDFAKDWIMPFLGEIPKMDKAQITIIYHHPSDKMDLDNKASFWMKVILDVLKTPTSKQQAKAWEKGYQIKTLSILPDDSSKYVNRILMEYRKGEECLELKIRGIECQAQTDLFSN